jgi:hypothetical protein
LKLIFSLNYSSIKYENGHFILHIRLELEFRVLFRA